MRIRSLAAGKTLSHIKQQIFSVFLVQNTEFFRLTFKKFLTRIGASGLPVTLLYMEREAGGERT